jgi:hypothetical protein
MNNGRKPLLGRVGRVQRQVRRFMWVCKEWPVTTLELLDRCYPRIRDGQYLEHHWKACRRAAERWLMRVGKRGRMALWVPKEPPP